MTEERSGQAPGRVEPSARRPEHRPVTGSLAVVASWLGAGASALTLFLTFLPLRSLLPAVAPIAVGPAVLQQTSKAGEYLLAALFYLGVPLLTVIVRAVALRLADRLASEEIRDAMTISLTAPLIIGPFIWASTLKPTWALVMPLVLSASLAAFVRSSKTGGRARAWVASRTGPAHLMLASGGIAATTMFYVTTGLRLAPDSVRFGELVAAAAFAGTIYLAGLIVAVAAHRFGRSVEEGLSIAGGAASAFVFALPLVLTLSIRPVVIVAAVFMFAIAIGSYAARAGRRSTGVRAFAVWIVMPLLLASLSFASDPSVSNWIDPFHRGETLGPASDYLRGQVPYRDVLPLHGLMEDGALDAWLMKLTERDFRVSVLRIGILGALTFAAIWILGMLLLDSIPLAILMTLLQLVFYTENQRILLQIGAVILLIEGFRRGRSLLVTIAGVAAGVEFFHSFDVGVYSIAGGFLALAVGSFAARRSGEHSIRWLRHAVFFAIGVVIGLSPFLAWLIALGAFGDFVRVTFVEIPRVIDAVWSTPYPYVAPRFGSGPSPVTLAQFLTGDVVRFLFAPLVLVAGSVVVLTRFVHRRFAPSDVAMIILLVFAGLSQRSAIGRADLGHQLFAAVLAIPLAVLLLSRLAAALRSLNPPSRAAWLTFSGAAALFGTLMMPEILLARMDAMQSYPWRVGPMRVTRTQSQAMPDKYRDVARAIGEHVPAGRPMFDASNQPIYYFMADRPNPTRFYQTPLLSPKRFQLETIAALERSRTSLVLRRSPDGLDRFDGIPNDVRAPILFTYIEDNFMLARQVRGSELWIRRADATFDMERYRSMDLVVRAGTLSPIAEERIVVPAEPGSVITLANPHARRAIVELRWKRADGIGWTRISLPAGSVQRWLAPPDMETGWIILLAAPGTRPLLVSPDLPMLPPERTATAGIAPWLRAEGSGPGEIVVVNVGDSTARITVGRDRFAIGEFDSVSFQTEEASAVRVDAGSVVGFLRQNERVHPMMVSATRIPSSH